VWRQMNGMLEAIGWGCTGAVVSPAGHSTTQVEKGSTVLPSRRGMLSEQVACATRMLLCWQIRRVCWYECAFLYITPTTCIGSTTTTCDQGPDGLFHLLSQFVCSLAHPLSRTLQAGLVYSRFQERGQVMVSAGLHALIVVCLIKRGIIAPIDAVWNCVESSSCVLVWPCMVSRPCVLSQGQGSCTIAVLVISLSSFLLVHHFLSLCTGLLTLVLYCHMWRSFLYLCMFG
jgi:hypothetical protein